MVTILSVAFTSPTRIEQERITSPLMWTEQAPHCATPQPYLVPVRPTCSRMTHSRGVSASTCTSRVLPLILSLAMEPPPGVVMTGVNLAATKVAAPRPSAMRNHSPADHGLPTAVCRASKLRERPKHRAARGPHHTRSSRTDRVPHDRVTNYTFDVSHDRTR